MREDGTITECDLDKANVLKDFFSSVFIDEGDAPSPPFSADFTNILNNVDITIKDVEKQLIFESLICGS